MTKPSTYELIAASAPLVGFVWLLVVAAKIHRTPTPTRRTVLLFIWVAGFVGIMTSGQMMTSAAEGGASIGDSLGYAAELVAGGLVLGMAIRLCSLGLHRLRHRFRAKHLADSQTAL